MSIYDYTVTDRSGNEVSLKQFEGKVLIIVNTATGCGFTPHYKPLEEMYEKYHDQGLEILDIPCNQFADQTPGSDDEVHSFCTLKYHTQFDQMHKSDVNGPNALPLYTYLKSCQPFQGFGKGPEGTDDEHNAQEDRQGLQEQSGYQMELHKIHRRSHGKSHSTL